MGFGNRTIEVDGYVEVRDLMEELGVTKLPEDAPVTVEQRVKIAVTADRDELVEELWDEIDDSRDLDLTDLREGLQAALSGDRHMAMALLGRCFDSFGRKRSVVEEVMLGHGRAADPALPQLSLPIAA